MSMLGRWGSRTLLKMRPCGPHVSPPRTLRVFHALVPRAVVARVGPAPFHVVVRQKDQHLGAEEGSEGQLGMPECFRQWLRRCARVRVVQGARDTWVWSPFAVFVSDPSHTQTPRKFEVGGLAGLEQDSWV